MNLRLFLLLAEEADFSVDDKMCYRYNVNVMNIGPKLALPPWLLLIFSLPAKSASQRVDIWRKLQRYGMLALRSAGYVLPNSPANQERMEWLAAAIRAYKGQASVVEVQAFDDLSDEQLQALFQEARSRDYQKLLHDAKKLVASVPTRKPGGRLNRIRRRLQELQDIDFFGSPLRAKVESFLASVEAQEDGKMRSSPSSKTLAISESPMDHASTSRHRSRVFGLADPALHRLQGPLLVWPRSRCITPMPSHSTCSGPQGFGHRGEDCTFETLCKEFAIRDKKVKRIAQIIHDADLGDDKFGRAEGEGLDRVLHGWAKQDLPDDELLRRGMDLIEGLYDSLD